MRNAVPLLAAADVLGVRKVFKAAVDYLARQMVDCRCCFLVWRACLRLEGEGPLSDPLTKVAAAARRGVLPAFERFRVTEEEALLSLPYEALLGLLVEDDLVVRHEKLLQDFLIKYGKVNGLLENSGKEVSVVGNAGSRWRALCAALRWCAIVDRDPKALEFAKFAIVREDAGPTNCSGPFGVSLARSGVGRDICRLFPQEFRVIASLHERARSGTKRFATWAQRAERERSEQRGGQQDQSVVAVAEELILRPRTRLCPPGACPLRPYQAEKLIYFMGAETLDFKEKPTLVSNDAASGLFNFCLMVWPLGKPDAVLPEREGSWVLSAYVQAEPLVAWPDVWEFKDVEFSIWCVPWDGTGRRVFERSAKRTFRSARCGYGWEEFISSSDLAASALELSDLLSPEGYLLIQAEVDPRSAAQGPSPVGE